MDIKIIKEQLIEQRKIKFKGNLYHATQVLFAYNSNKIEGSRLTPEETEMIFETNSFMSRNEKIVHLDDLIETTNHFRLFDYMLDHVDEPLTKEIIIEMNVILKKGTSYEKNPLFNVGGFKIVPNEIGIINPVKTTSPENVTIEIDNLLFQYTKKHNITFNDIIEFHFKFEQIHPFGDGNGRVGRMIMFKECLKNNIVPFIILDQYKQYYINGLKQFSTDKAYLTDACLGQQDYYDELANKYLKFVFENLVQNNNN